MAEIDRFSVGGTDCSVTRSYAGHFVRYSDHLSDKAAELEELAGEFEAKQKAREELFIWAGIERDNGAAVAYKEAATRLRERAAELRGGN